MKSVIPIPKDYSRRCYAARLIFGFVLRQRLEVLREHATISGLDEFDADKTMRLLDKFWAARPGRGDAFAQGKLAYLPVERDLNAKHGHRVGFPTTLSATGEDNQPVLDVMLAYDAIVVPTARILSVHDEESDFGLIRRFDSQVSAARLTELIAEELITVQDVTFLESAGRMFGALNPDEMVAIGRHESAGGTRSAILWELDRWQRASTRAIASLRSIDGSSVDFELQECGKDVWSSVSFAYECLKKAGIGGDVYGSDRDAYRLGLAKLAAAAVSDELREPLKCQPAGEAIWDSPEVCDVKLAAFAAWTFSLYLLSCRGLPAFEDTALPRRFTRVSSERLREAEIELRRLLSMDGSWQPTNFSRQALASAQSGGRTIPNTSPPRDVADLGRFCDEATTIFDTIISRFVMPKLRSWRMQLA